MTLPVLAAPMAGGPTTPELVVAAARAGGMGFIAGGYRTPDALTEHLRVVRAGTATFGVNLFAPNPVPVDPAAYARYRDEVRPEAERLGATVPEHPLEDDDHWQDKIDLLTSDPVPVVSFTFGIPDRSALAALRAAGSLLMQTVTSPDEAAHAADAGVDALVVQGCDAGGHSATLTPAIIPPGRPLPELVAAVRARVDLPVIAAGGVDTSARAAEAIGARAEATVVGTALLRAPEAGTSAAHRAALSGPDRGPTIMTLAFSGRPARALRNSFLTAHHEHAPLGYPALHHLTSPMRRMAAAVDDPEHVNLWAGVGYRSSAERPAAAILEDLASGL
ncbi:MAG TPA: nitronate monooxygenase [Acidimicrobiales bacterium]|nr:nitronate monooxygenase [Acidimicrobiales bacterium]